VAAKMDNNRACELLLMCVCMCVCVCLCRGEADALRQDELGRTALHVAVESGALASMDSLVCVCVHMCLGVLHARM